MSDIHYIRHAPHPVLIMPDTHYAQHPSPSTSIISDIHHAQYVSRPLSIISDFHHAQNASCPIPIMSDAHHAQYTSHPIPVMSDIHHVRYPACPEQQAGASQARAHRCFELIARTITSRMARFQFHHAAGVQINALVNVRCRMDPNSIGYNNIHPSRGSAHPLGRPPPLHLDADPKTFLNTVR